MNRDVWYVGSSPMNGICNESFYGGAITFYPTNEKGNLFFTDRTDVDKNDPAVKKEFRNFIEEKVNWLQSNNDVEFILFNDKRNITKLCSDIPDMNVVQGNNLDLIDLLNDKFEVRKILQFQVPVLKYLVDDYKSISYQELSQKFNDSVFVVQGRTGAGGNNTYKVSSENDFKELSSDKLEEIAISKYKRSIPLNVTMVIGESNCVNLGISAQLISVLNKKFKYVGGDFALCRLLKKKTVSTVTDYSRTIAEIIQKLGYRGILGIDYILCDNDDIYFMEINPRYQSSTFMISRYLNKMYGTCVAELQYHALKGNLIPNYSTSELYTIGSFINSNIKIDLGEEPDEIIYNGYSSCNKESYYRLLYKDSLINKSSFEHI